MNAPGSKPRVVAIIQARMGSTRLADKTLAEIAGKPLLEHVIERARASQTLEDIVVATTIEPQDGVILSLASQCHVRSYAGSVDDVLDRFYQAARESNAEVIVRITADDPFKDPQVLDLIVEHLLTHPELDYVSNTIEPTFPEGLDIEAFSFEALECAWREAQLPSEREHVTPYIWKHPDRFGLANVCHSSDLSSCRWTLDYDEDLRFAREVYRRLAHKGMFLMDDILTLLSEEPDLIKINQGIERNMGYKLSIQKDAKPADHREQEDQ